MIGFDKIKSELLHSFQNHKLHHAILLHGKKGIGKAGFAKELANQILGASTLQHPDLFLIEKDAEKKEIGVDKIRSIKDFATQTSAISQYKIIIIDSACELNKSSSNALLKILEEPRPNSFLFLISHNLNRVLATIRSRCHLVTISNLSAVDFREILQQKNPDLSGKNLEFLSEICDNAPADAINIGADLARFYELFLRSIANKKISEELLKKISDKSFPFLIAEKSCEFFFSRLSKSINTSAISYFFEEEKVFLNLIRKFPPEKIFSICDESLKLLRKTTALNLDKKLSFINIFNNLCY